MCIYISMYSGFTYYLKRPEWLGRSDMTNDSETLAKNGQLSSNVSVPHSYLHQGMMTSGALMHL